MCRATLQWKNSIPRERKKKEKKRDRKRKIERGNESKKEASPD